MTREKIEKAAKEYAKKECCHYDEETPNAVGFVAGAHWVLDMLSGIQWDEAMLQLCKYCEEKEAGYE